MILPQSNLFEILEKVFTTDVYMAN